MRSAQIGPDLRLAANRILSSKRENAGNDVAVNLVGRLSRRIGRMRLASEI